MSQILHEGYLKLKNDPLFIWNSSLNEYPVVLFAKSGNRFKTVSPLFLPFHWVLSLSFKIFSSYFHWKTLGLEQIIPMILFSFKLVPQLYDLRSVSASLLATHSLVLCSMISTFTTQQSS